MIFYGMARKAMLGRRDFEITIVSGPAICRHCNAARSIGAKFINIYEISKEVYEKILESGKSLKGVKIHCASVEKSNDPFIDCDLTGISEIPSIKNTLRNQSSIPGKKAFIWTVAEDRREKSKKIDNINIIKSILDTISAGDVKIVNKIRLKTPRLGLKDSLGRERHGYIDQIDLETSNKNILSLLCFKYNSGGGNMLTCYIEYI